MASQGDSSLDMKLPSINSGELVEVCELFSPAHFYLHRVQDRGRVDRMMGEMRKAYGMSVDRKQLWLNPADVELGMMVAARWGEEGWHRVKVVEFYTNKVEVVYVDFGSRGDVGRDRLCKLHPRFLETPPLAIAAGLAVKPRPPATSWANTEATVRLHGIVKPDAQVPFRAIVLERGGRKVLDLQTPSSGGSLSELLVNEKLAVFEGTSIYPQECTGENTPRILTGSVVDSIVKTVNQVPVLPMLIFPQLEKLIDRTALIAAKKEVLGQEQVVSDTLALSLDLIKAKWDVKKEKMEGWVERRRRVAAEKSRGEKTATSLTPKDSVVVATESESGIYSGAKTVSTVSSTRDCVTLSSTGAFLHFHRSHNEVFVASKEASALVPAFKGRDLVINRLAVMGITVATEGLGGQLLPLKSLPTILQLIYPDAVDAIADIKGLIKQHLEIKLG